jgi:hypothetical protein
MAQDWMKETAQQIDWLSIDPVVFAFSGPLDCAHGNCV